MIRSFFSNLQVNSSHFETLKNSDAYNKVGESQIDKSTLTHTLKYITTSLNLAFTQE